MKILQTKNLGHSLILYSRRYDNNLVGSTPCSRTVLLEEHVDTLW